MRERYFFYVDGKIYDEFFNPDNCWVKEYYIEMRKETTEDIIVEGAEMLRGDDSFYCDHPKIHEVGSTSESECGRLCEYYKPRNGKNGRCVYHKNCYEHNGSLYRVTKNGRFIKIKETGKCKYQKY